MENKPHKHDTKIKVLNESPKKPFPRKIVKPGRFKIIWMSNAPNCPTGYGVVTRHVTSLLKKKNWDIEVLAYWGLEGGVIVYDNVTVYPKMFAPFGQDAAGMIVKHIRPEVFVTLFDVWVATEWMPKFKTRWIAYAPIDHQPMPEGVRHPLSLCYQPVAMSKFGLAMMKQGGLTNAKYIPHGVPTEIFKPKDTITCRNQHVIRQPPNFKDSFVVGLNYANKGLRKSQDRMFGAFKIFLEQNPDAKKDSYLYVNSWMQFPEGMNQPDLIKKMGIGPNVIIVNEWKKYISMSDREMAEWYNCCNVFMNIAQGEGFGIPIIEACACGVPPITTNFSSMPELTAGHGWLVPITEKFMTYLNSFMALANVQVAAEILGKAYNSPDEVKKLGHKARLFSLDYDYEKKIVPMWDKLLQKVKTTVAKPFDKPNIALAKKK